MIYVKFLIDWPFKWPNNKEESYKNKDYLLYDKKLSKYKNFEIQISKWDEVSELFNIELDTRWSGRDHAGLCFELTVWNFFFNIQTYDSRHWNYDTGTWEKYEDQDDQT